MGCGIHASHKARGSGSPERLHVTKRPEACPPHLSAPTSFITRSASASPDHSASVYYSTAVRPILSRSHSPLDVASSPLARSVVLYVYICLVASCTSLLFRLLFTLQGILLPYLRIVSVV